MSNEGNYVIKTREGKYGYIDQMTGGYPAATDNFGSAQRWLTAEDAYYYAQPGNDCGFEVHKIVEVVTKPVKVGTEMIPKAVFEDPVTA